ncbi:hypothetical protein [Ligilactobacillus equi]|nr:hypothetical protein [Ligilactobacillus equi]
MITRFVELSESKLRDKAIEYNFKTIKTEIEIRKYYMSGDFEFHIGRRDAVSKYPFASYLDGVLEEYTERIPKSYESDARKFLEMVTSEEEK